MWFAWVVDSEGEGVTGRQVGVVRLGRVRVRRVWCAWVVDSEGEG